MKRLRIVVFSFVFVAISGVLWAQEGVAIESLAFPGVYLRMDGSGVTQFVGSGAGVVNAQRHDSREHLWSSHGGWERFRIIHLEGDIVAIESVAFPHVFLRLDGSGVADFLGGGGGTVNTQFHPDRGDLAQNGAWEKFRMIRLGEDRYAFESLAFPRVYLRLDGSGVAEFSGSGAGTVNAQFHRTIEDVVRNGPWEKFRIIYP